MGSPSLPMSLPAGTPQDTSKKWRAKYQFTLRSILVLMGIVAALCSAIFAGPAWLSVFLTFFAIFGWPGTLTVAIVYGRGYVRSFCIAALLPSVFGAMVVYLLNGVLILVACCAEDFETAGELLVPCWSVFGVLFGFSVACGLLGMLARWMAIADDRPGTLKAES